MQATEQKYENYRNLLDGHGQQHLLRFWPRLNERQRRQLLDDLEQIDFQRCAALAESHVKRKPPMDLPARIDPPEILPAQADAEHERLYRQAQRAGAEAIRTGRVAAFTVAGGQGTRLGFDGPKGAFPITPIRHAPLFQVFAESLLGVERRFGRRPRWYIMTSPSNHADTVSFFKTNAFFGLGADDVRFFPQGQMPAFLPDGRIALSEMHRVALSPDGHGGSLRALAVSGALAEMRTSGVDYISYFQVDNPLVNVVDPLFIGLHMVLESEMSSKAVPKVDDLEKVGNFCLADGRLTVIEYSDLPRELAHQHDADGSRRFDAGSIAIHVLSREFVERLTRVDARSQESGAGAEVAGNVELPWHRAEKKVSTVDEEGRPVEPDKPNAVKLEMFVFDAVPLARNPLVMYTRREEEFSPVKNATGVDSADTARRDLVRRAARWLGRCGTQVPRRPDGEPTAPIEISPRAALGAEDLCAQLPSPPRLEAGEPYLLA